MWIGLSPKVSLWFGFALSLPAAMISGLEMSFNVYALPLKETFNYTQTQVEVVACMATTGVALSCLEALFTWMFGFKVTYLVIGIGVPLSSGLFSLAAYYKHVFHYWPSVICAIQVCLATTNCMGFYAVSRVYVEIFPHKHMGKLVALYAAICCVGKVYFGAVLDIFFGDTLAGFFLSISVVSVFCYNGCFAFLYPIATNKETQRALGLNTDEEEENGVNTDYDVSNKDMLSSPFFHVTFWSSVLFFGCTLTCMNNITTIADSMQMYDPLQTVYVIAFVICVARLLVGGLFDKYSSETCGFALLFFTYFNFIGAMIICLFFLDTSYMLVTTILIGIGVGPGLTVPVSILLLRFGRSHYSAVAGSFFAVAGSCEILLQIIIGLSYDAKILERGLTGRKCDGRDCFYWPFVLMLSVSLAGTVIQIFNYIISIGSRKRNCTS